MERKLEYKTDLIHIRAFYDITNSNMKKICVIKKVNSRFRYIKIEIFNIFFMGLVDDFIYFWF
jgi:hypothetical protein